jgi:hypothetical protein
VLILVRMMWCADADLLFGLELSSQSASKESEGCMTCLLTSSQNCASFDPKALACIGLGSWRMLALFESLVASSVHDRSTRHCHAQSFPLHSTQLVNPR